MLRFKTSIKYVFIFLWIVGATVAVYKQYQYGFTVGKASAFVENFPQDSLLSFNNNKYNLITFIHPKCVCSKATLENLKVLNKLYSDRVYFHVVFYMPQSKKDDWKTSSFIEEVKNFENTEIYFDENEKEFLRFDAQTSGLSFLFSENREMIFKGGLTESRGHGGESPSMRSIVSLLESKNQQLVTAPTFGCQNNIKKN